MCEHLAESYVDEAVDRPLKRNGIVSCLISCDRRPTKTKAPRLKESLGAIVEQPSPENCSIPT